MSMLNSVDLPTPKKLEIKLDRIQNIVGFVLLVNLVDYCKNTCDFTKLKPQKNKYRNKIKTE